MRQVELPYGPEAVDAMHLCLEEFTSRGGEGVIVRDPQSWWIPERSHKMIKIKKYLDAEAKVTGYTTGRATDKGSKLLGMMGALVTEFNGKRLELSGFTDAERELNNEEAFDWACDNPGEEVPDWIEAKHFPRGSIITFTYRDLSRDGIPQEARYYRKRG